MKGNSVSIKGNLTRNAEIRGKSGDRACVAFGLAWNNNRLRPDNTLQDQVHYFDVSCWMSAGQQNYFMPQLTKGATCSIIDGYLSYDTWQTKEGEKRSKVEISVVDPVSSMVLIAPRKTASGLDEPSSDAIDAARRPEEIESEETAPGIAASEEPHVAAGVNPTSLSPEDEFDCADPEEELETDD